MKYIRYLFVKDHKLIGNASVADHTIEYIKQYRDEHYPDAEIFKEVEE